MTRAKRPKEPLPDRACATCMVALYAAGSPDLATQLDAFDRAHPTPEHEIVPRLPANHGDVSWDWRPGVRALTDDVQTTGGRL